MSILVLCKFTPLGFETYRTDDKNPSLSCVNLPRWGLKPEFWASFYDVLSRVNLPRWGLKQTLEFVAG